jgi:RimJ/RimL family protein N-acetyltransferase
VVTDEAEGLDSAALDRSSAAYGFRLTARLSLEPIGLQHADDLVRLHQDPVVATWFAGAWSPAEAETFAKSARRAWLNDGVHKWIAYQRPDAVLVGRGGLSRMQLDAPTTVQIAALTEGTDWSNSRLEVGWSLLSDFHGQGYATEIGREGLRFAHTAFAAESVIAFTERHNLASRKVMERLGMLYVGEIAARGLVEGQRGEFDDAPFAVYLKQISA